MLLIGKVHEAVGTRFWTWPGVMSMTWSSWTPCRPAGSSASSASTTNSRRSPASARSERRPTRSPRCCRAGSPSCTSSPPRGDAGGGVPDAMTDIAEADFRRWHRRQPGPGPDPPKTTSTPSPAGQSRPPVPRSGDPSPSGSGCRGQRRRPPARGERRTSSGLISGRAGSGQSRARGAPCSDLFRTGLTPGRRCPRRGTCVVQRWCDGLPASLGAHALLADRYCAILCCGAGGVGATTTAPRSPSARPKARPARRRPTIDPARRSPSHRPGGQPPPGRRSRTGRQAGSLGTRRCLDAETDLRRGSSSSDCREGGSDPR